MEERREGSRVPADRPIGRGGGVNRGVDPTIKQLSESCSCLYYAVSWIHINLQSVLPRLSCSPFILREIASLSGRDSTTRQDDEEERGEIDRGLLRKRTLFLSEKEEKQIHRNRVPQTVFAAVC